MFIEKLGELYRILLVDEAGGYVISYDHPCSPVYLSQSEMDTYRKVEPPESFKKETGSRTELSKGRRERVQMIEALLLEERCICDRSYRKIKIRELALQYHTTEERLKRLYYRALAGRSMIENRKQREKPISEDENKFHRAIEKYYYSAKKMSLRTCYDLMLLAEYTDEDGNLKLKHPSWHVFRHHFYDNRYHRKASSKISRQGLSAYQRNRRVLTGRAAAWKDRLGAYQIDATQADIYLVSSLDRKEVIGRPYIYMAVDTASQLITGFYIGFEAGEQAVINCLVNAAEDKKAFCHKYGIEIEATDWSCEGLPFSLISDKGREFLGGRVTELAMRYGIEAEALPPFRPDQKGLIEKSFDLLQQKYKPLLRGKGVIEEDAQERWAVDYRKQAVLSLEEFIKVVIHCVLYLNASRRIESLEGRATTASKLWESYMLEGRSGIIELDPEELYRFSLRRKTATAERKGINVDGLWYNGSAYRSAWESGSIGKQVSIAYDTEKIDQIYIVNENGYIPLTLSKHQMGYIGSCAKEYQLKKKSLRQTRKEAEDTDKKGRLKMLKDIQEIVKGACVDEV